MHKERDLQRICKDISSLIESELNRIGAFYRIFSRVKSYDSVQSKIGKKGLGYYDGINKFIRDTIGIRVILYFPDDLSLLYNYLKSRFVFIEETVDELSETQFAPSRRNLIFKIPQNLINEFQVAVNDRNLDATFELQLRTILAEGWHEIDHDLRYKCTDDWNESSDLARNFNGVLASLETSEYAILRIFEQISHRHYKQENIAAMLRTKFRIRFASYNMSDAIKSYVNKDLIREIYKIDRILFLQTLLERNIHIPLTIDNIIFSLNTLFIKNENLINNTPTHLTKQLTYEP
ncbi:MAG: RelA/SpoT family protein [Taibaiella sp.]|nr:RelA/SpoT family protein [Taibaiella sp.]